METGTLFRIQNDSRLRAEQLMEAINFYKDEVGGYAYYDEQNLITQIKWSLEQQLFKY